MTSGGGVVLREKRRYVLRRGCPGEACEELDHVEVLLAAVRMRLIILAWVAAPRQVLFRPRPCGSRPPADRLLRPPVRGIDAVVCEEGEQGLFLGVEVLCELAVLVVGLSVVGEHRDALCEVGHDGLSLLFAEIPGIEGSMRISRTLRGVDRAQAGRSAISSSHRLSRWAQHVW